MSVRLQPQGSRAQWLGIALALICSGFAHLQPAAAAVPLPASAPQPNAQIHRAVTPMARCMATWDRTSQMSKREWRASCKRVVKTNPRLYNKPF